MVDKEILDAHNRKYLYGILDCDDMRSATALHTYANYLNKTKLRYDYIPLYLRVFKTNNKYAVDALLSGYVVKRFFNFVLVPNGYIIRNIFEIFAQNKPNALYEQTVRVFCGFLKKAYRSVEDGYRVFPVGIPDVNSLAKYLDESKGQNFDINRDILDILRFFTDLDQLFETDMARKDIAKQAIRIRSDFFDHKRSLKQSMTKVMLEQAENVDPGISPEGIFLD
ncbi:MAG: hypothetical protein GY866_05300 [Proteobacteria bacterium]|nr:hypothetical protein [Pseudomonadota bacterium]